MNIMNSVFLRRCRRWVFEEVSGRYDEKCPRDCRGKIKNSVVFARRITHKHALEHQFSNGGRAGVADEVRSKLSDPHRTKGHVVTYDVVLDPLLIDDGVERDMGVRGLDVVRQFYVREFCAANNLRLLFDRETCPPTEVVKVLLSYDVT